LGTWLSNATPNLWLLPRFLTLPVFLSLSDPQNWRVPFSGLDEHNLPFFPTFTIQSSLLKEKVFSCGSAHYKNSRLPPLFTHTLPPVCLDFFFTRQPKPSSNPFLWPFSLLLVGSEFCRPARQGSSLVSLLGIIGNGFCTLCHVPDHHFFPYFEISGLPLHYEMNLVKRLLFVLSWYVSQGMFPLSPDISSTRDFLKFPSTSRDLCAIHAPKSLSYIFCPS